jgi:fermentation-respiration switch protein FrsA (DUF1100 family)
MEITKKNVRFNANGLQLAGVLRLPENYSDKKTPAIVTVHPISSSKEQTSGLYAERLSNLGYITLAYDASYQGESEGETRHIEDPNARVEDIRSAIDYLTTLDYVDENRIGVLGICGGGGYSVTATMTDRRVKALGTIAGVNFGHMSREGDGSPDAAIKVLEEVSKQRTAEARGDEGLIINYMPNTPEERDAAGMTTLDMSEAVDYYRTPRGYHPNSQNKRRFTSIDKTMAYDAFHLADKLLTQPLQIIVGGKAGEFGSYRDGYELYNKAASKKKDLYVIENVSHYDLYDLPKGVDPAMKKLEYFYKEYL